jgi:hypothetical protein
MRDVGEPNGIGEVCLEEFFRPGDEATCPWAGPPGSDVGVECQTENTEQQFLRSEVLEVAAHDRLEKPSPQQLQADVRPSASAAEQRMERQARLGGVGELCENPGIWCDDELRVVGGDGLAQVEAFSAETNNTWFGSATTSSLPTCQTKSPRYGRQN